MAAVSSVRPSPLAPNEFTDAPTHTARASVPEPAQRIQNKTTMNVIFTVILPLLWSLSAFPGSPSELAAGRPESRIVLLTARTNGACRLRAVSCSFLRMAVGDGRIEFANNIRRQTDNFWRSRRQLSDRWGSRTERPPGLSGWLRADILRDRIPRNTPIRLVRSSRSKRWQ